MILLKFRVTAFLNSGFGGETGVGFKNYLFSTHNDGGFPLHPIKIIQEKYYNTCGNDFHYNACTFFIG